MLLVGIDWAEAEHAVCLMDASGAVVRRLKIAHSPQGVRRVHAAIASLVSQPTDVLVAIERPDGLLVEALLTAGYTVYALNPKAVERYRQRVRTSNAKSDPADAELLARVLVTDRERHRPVLPSSALVEEIRAIARQDERASRDQQRLLNRLRQDLLEAFPQAVGAFTDRNTVSALTFLERWPTAEQAQQLSLRELNAFLRGLCHPRPAVAAASIHAALHAETLPVPPARARAAAGGIQLTAQQLLLLYRQRQAWATHLRHLLADASGAAHPDGEVLLSLPGLDVVLAARVLGELGDRHERFPTSAALQCYAGTAPITRASGRLRVVVARRACNRVLRQAVLRWAFCSLPHSAWAHRFYDRQRAAGKTAYAAQRALANRWLEILHHLLATHQPYDAAVHERNCATRTPLVAA